MVVDQRGAERADRTDRGQRERGARVELGEPVGRARVCERGREHEHAVDERDELPADAARDAGERGTTAVRGRDADRPRSPRTQD